MAPTASNVEKSEQPVRIGSSQVQFRRLSCYIQIFKIPGVRYVTERLSAVSEIECQ